MVTQHRSLSRLQMAACLQRSGATLFMNAIPDICSTLQRTHQVTEVVQLLWIVLHNCMYTLKHDPGIKWTFPLKCKEYFKSSTHLQLLLLSFGHSTATPEQHINATVKHCQRRNTVRLLKQKTNSLVTFMIFRWIILNSDHYFAGRCNRIPASAVNRLHRNSVA